MRELFGSIASPIRQVTFLALYQFAFLIMMFFLVTLGHFFSYQPEQVRNVSSCLNGVIAEVRENSAPMDRRSSALQFLFSALPRFRSEISSLSQFAIPFLGICFALTLFLTLLLFRADYKAREFFRQIGDYGAFSLGVAVTSGIFITFRFSSYSFSIASTISGPFGIVLGITAAVGLWCVCSLFVLDILARNKFTAYVISPKSDLEVLGVIFIFSLFGLCGGIVSYFTHIIT